MTARTNALTKLEKEFEQEVEDEKPKVEKPKPNRIGTNIGVVIYDDNPDIQTMQRTKSSTTTYTTASNMTKPLISDALTLQKTTSYIEEIQNHQDRSQGPWSYVLRVLLCIWNFTMFSIGITMIVLGSWALLKIRLDILKNPLGITSEPLFIIIVVGCIMTLISFQGALGFFRGNTIMLSGMKIYLVVY